MRKRANVIFWAMISVAELGFESLRAHLGVLEWVDHGKQKPKECTFQSKHHKIKAENAIEHRNRG